jgi:hypothetical protein
MNHYVDYALPVCPGWPNSSEPATAEEAIKVNGWGYASTNNPCRWRHIKAAEYGLPVEPQVYAGPVQIQIPIGSTVPKEARKQVKYYFCETHKATAEKIYVRDTAWFYNLQKKLLNYWKFGAESYQTPSGYHGWKVTAVRKFIIDTMRKMW